MLPEVCLARVPTRLVYARAQSAKDCPDEPALVDAVAARLAYDPFSPWGDQTILATVSRVGSTVLGRAELIDHDGIAQGSREVKVRNGDLATCRVEACDATLRHLGEITAFSHGIAVDDERIYWTQDHEVRSVERQATP